MPKDKSGLRGRPAVAEENRRSTIVRVLTTESEHEELKQAADAASMTVSTWMRSVALEKARAWRGPPGTSAPPEAYGGGTTDETR